MNAALEKEKSLKLVLSPAKHKRDLAKAAVRMFYEKAIATNNLPNRGSLTINSGFSEGGGIFSIVKSMISVTEEVSESAMVNEIAGILPKEVDQNSAEFLVRWARMVIERETCYDQLKAEVRKNGNYHKEEVI